MTVEQSYDWLGPKLSLEERGALDSIYAEVRRLRAMLEPTPDARELVNHLFGIDPEMYTRYSPMYIKVLQQQNEAAQLIAAHDARLLDEAAERGVRWVGNTLGYELEELESDTLRAAIKGAAHE